MTLFHILWQVLTLLWDLAHLPKLSPHLVELALREHHSILSDAYLIKDAVKKNFILRCIDDIKKVSDCGFLLRISVFTLLNKVKSADICFSLNIE